MLTLTKIFHFETAHAIHNYAGACKHIHGHSYELQVTVSPRENIAEKIAAPGFILDFKELKKIVQVALVDQFDHHLILSEAYLAEHPEIRSHENLLAWDCEPTAENMVLYILQVLREKLPEAVRPVKLRLYETKDSYAEWTE